MKVTLLTLNLNTLIRSMKRYSLLCHPPTLRLTYPSPFQHQVSLSIFLFVFYVDYFAYVKFECSFAVFQITICCLDSIPYIASVILSPDESSSFHVTFQPTGSRVYRGRIKLSVVDNQFEEHKIQLYGEGFQVRLPFHLLQTSHDFQPRDFIGRRHF